MIKPKVCLTIAGLDPSGGAGIIADIKTFSTFGCYATAAIASITFQNTTGVFGAVHQTAETIRGQVEPVLKDFHVAAVKTGMLPTREVIEETARLIRENDLTNIVVDPVVRSTSGFDLIDDVALTALIELLFPISSIVTPNIQEAERITGVSIRTVEDIVNSATMIRSMGADNVLIKGGHFEAETISRQKVRDYLFTDEGRTVFDADYIDTTSTHGTGCTLAAAIAANLALGKDLKDAISISKSFVNEAIRTAPDLGSGHSPINIPNSFIE
ncbi:MAG: bifunctional hydroxymethylpyrimidine kinase/phosphomethylpyrimidine kinase [Pyrinomonadaceae bacterium]